MGSQILLEHFGAASSFAIVEAHTPGDIAVADHKYPRFS